MTLLTVKKNRFPFQGSELVRGQKIDTNDFPAVGVTKWWQLLDLGYLDLVDQPGVEIEKPFTGQRVRVSDPGASREVTRIRGVMNRTETLDPARWTALPGDEETVRAPEPVAPSALDCAACDFTAKTPHGLKVHVGRRHKE